MIYKTKNYKLIKKYPGSPEIETILTTIDENYVIVRPDLYPEFWERLDEEHIIAKTLDGYELLDGDRFYVIDPNRLCITPFFITKKSNFKEDVLIFKDQEKAKEKLNDFIDLQIELETITKENIILYGVCTKADWNKNETTSLKLTINKFNNKNRIASNSWKHFRTKEEREHFIKSNKPLFSLNEIKQVLLKENIFTIEKYKIFSQFEQIASAKI